MKYKNIVQGIFRERPNRFIAICEIEGMLHRVHVKNTGRCKELLVPHAVVYLEESQNPERKTKYSLIAVQKGERLINMDSQAPNIVVEEALRKGIIHLYGINEPLVTIKREVTYGKSRFDFYIETAHEKVFIEVKGVTLEEDNIVKFPDAPTQRGVKHIQELISAKKEGYRSYILFVVQMEQAEIFVPNEITHPEFANVLRLAQKEGVGILAYNCKVSPSSLELAQPVLIRLEKA